MVVYNRQNWIEAGDNTLVFFHALKQEVVSLPYKSLVPCRHQNCPALIKPGTMYCEEHKPLHPEVVRSAHSRGYNKRWQRESKTFLKSHPLCEECKKNGRYVQATVVDHIVPHRGDQKLFWDRENWRALCKSCHDKKTGREDMHPVYHY